MREALGLDYSKSSYPQAQVCDKRNQIPQSGVDSIVFPEIKFTLASLMGGGESTSPLVPGTPKMITAVGKLVLHGVKHKVEVPLKLTLSATSLGLLKVQGEFEVSLTDYGIVVRPVLFVTVKDTAHISVDLKLKEK